MKGFIGKLLEINLSNKETIEEPLNEEIAKNFLGGTGYACRYLYDHLDKDTDPLSPDNILMFMTGPFLGSTIPGSRTFAICAKSPYPGIWGEYNTFTFLHDIDIFLTLYSFYRNFFLWTEYIDIEP